MIYVAKEKLVRDRIPELIRNSGDEPVVRKANQHELESFLLDKIVEEALEFKETGDVDELVDILEVIYYYVMYIELFIDDRQNIWKM